MNDQHCHCNCRSAARFMPHARSTIRIRRGTARTEPSVGSSRRVTGGPEHYVDIVGVRQGDGP